MKAGAEGEGEGGDADVDADLAAIAGDNAELLTSLKKVRADARESAQANWRQTIAGGNEKLLKRLERIASLEDLGRSYENAETAARAKGGLQLPGDDAKPEDIANFYTASMGRPEKFEDLKIQPVTLPEGEELTDDESKIISGVLGAMHKAGNFGAKAGNQFQTMAQVVADLLVGGRVEMGRRVQAGQDASKKVLETAWGKGDYDRNLKMANAYASQLCMAAGVKANELGDLLLQDGTRLGDNPLYARAMAAGGRDAGEDLVIIPSDDNGRTVEQLEADYGREMKLSRGSPAERKEYDSPQAKERREKLGAQIRKAGGSIQRAARNAGKPESGGAGSRANDAKVGKRA